MCDAVSEPGWQVMCDAVSEPGWRVKCDFSFELDRNHLSNQFSQP